MTYSYAQEGIAPLGSSFSGLAVGTQPAPASNGFLKFLNELVPVVEGAADVFRQAKGFPARYAPAQERAMAGEALGRWLEERSLMREQRRREQDMSQAQSLVEDQENSIQRGLAKIFEDPEVLKSASALFMSPAIDPASLGVRMIPTPVPRFRPQPPARAQ